MPSQHPEEVGYGYVIEHYATRKDSGHARYLELNGTRVLRPGWPHAKLEALLAYEWRSHLSSE